MSNPFRDLPEHHPYADRAQDYSTPGYGAPLSGNPLLAPAIILLLLSVLTILMVLMSLPSQFIRLRAIGTSTPEGFGTLVGFITGLALWLVITVAIAYGSISMMRLSGYRSACLAAILSLIPLCSPCYLLGIPFGIWALVLLNRPEVKQRFSP